MFECSDEVSISVSFSVLIAINIALFMCALASPSPKYITGPPLNLTAVYGDTSTSLTCATDRPGGQVNWFAVYVGQAMMTTVVQGCTLNPSLVNSYVLRDPVDMTPCDLGAISVDRPLAGAYTCQESAGFDPPFSAQFVVLGERHMFVKHCWYYLTFR